MLNKILLNGIELFLPIKKGYKKMLSNKIYLTLLLSVVLFSSCSKSEEKQVREEIAKEITDEMVDRKIQQKNLNEEKLARAVIREKRKKVSYQQNIVIDALKAEGKMTSKDYWKAYGLINTWSNGRHDNEPNYGDINSIDLSLYENSRYLKALRELESEGK